MPSTMLKPKPAEAVLSEYQIAKARWTEIDGKHKALVEREERSRIFRRLWYFEETPVASITEVQSPGGGAPNKDDSTTVSQLIARQDGLQQNTH